ncbi:MAG: DNA alkylation repair protein [Candidatus Levybacteria bacterium CG_4_10_14_0_2_um_filter_36_16]|nr:MAG: DNA alkylation repair protein [Candidatus Levybacteria bacterium CG2_30_37_29]PIR79111.1 MAG: DNA alkylation repair protein [Candidatus Levybacteria bacterium CG10_big_fil_rev_8_21_14_0_10_36_30]PIZ97622.1 MAG: DNA alkylation repair protein [Candidatus Levybacteria bacterium CG_4_10_14_0_2_um_filter_36_16]PJA90256.1 MAG: DNA alkylation repair protein [Candidatus Levybacteria bacterium CG_4_9_14_3_um_filter_36_7]
MDYLSDLHHEVRSIANPGKAKILSGFFKTGKGEYGEGDIFLGLTVPQSRKIVFKYKNLSINEVKILLSSKIHEERLIALLILVHNFEKGSDKEKEAAYKIYLQNTQYINNWDLVDLTAPKIVGEWLINKNRSILTKLARSKNLWERRIAMIATHQFICKNKTEKDTFEIAEILIDDKHDLIQKAVGWMLREVGKRIGQGVEEEFLKKHYKKMGRTSLRYAIERFPEKIRKQYLLSKIQA